MFRGLASLLTIACLLSATLASKAWCIELSGEANAPQATSLRGGHDEGDSSSETSPDPEQAADTHEESSDEFGKEIEGLIRPSHFSWGLFRVGTILPQDKLLSSVPRPTRERPPRG